MNKAVYVIGPITLMIGEEAVSPKSIIYKFLYMSIILLLHHHSSRLLVCKLRNFPSEV